MAHVENKQETAAAGKKVTATNSPILELEPNSEHNIVRIISDLSILGHLRISINPIDRNIRGTTDRKVFSSKSGILLPSNWTHEAEIVFRITTENTAIIPLSDSRYDFALLSFSNSCFDSGESSVSFSFSIILKAAAQVLLFEDLVSNFTLTNTSFI